MSRRAKTEPHHYVISGRAETYATREEAAHARRRLFGIRALAHPIVRVIGKPRGWTQ